MTVLNGHTVVLKTSHPIALPALQISYARDRTQRHVPSPIQTNWSSTQTQKFTTFLHFPITRVHPSSPKYYAILASPAW
jgi:hypothetical protein